MCQRTLDRRVIVSRVYPEMLSEADSAYPDVAKCLAKPVEMAKPAEQVHWHVRGESPS